jgi:urease accessory protein
MRGDGPFLFTQVTHGVGVQAVVEHVIRRWKGRR